MAEADSETTDLSLGGLRIADLVIGCIFAAASLYATPRCADGCALAAADIYAFLLIFWKSWASQ
jgi:hypothetical protein